MNMAQLLAGFTLGEADLAAPRDGEEEARGDGQDARRRSLAGRPSEGVDARIANDIFDQVEKFAGYAFNEGACRRDTPCWPSGRPT